MKITSTLPQNQSYWVRNGSEKKFQSLDELTGSLREKEDKVNIEERRDPTSGELEQAQQFGRNAQEWKEKGTRRRSPVPI